MNDLHEYQKLRFADRYTSHRLKKQMLPSDAVKMAIDALKDIANSRKMPSGFALDQLAGDLYADAAETLESTLQSLLDQENGISYCKTNWT